MNMLFSIPLLLLSYVFLSAARQKFSNRVYTHRVVENYQLAPASYSVVITAMLIFGEFCTGILLVVPGFEILAMSLSILLFSVYSAAVAINLIKGRLALDCGCHGPNHRQSISRGLLIRNLLILSVIALLLWRGTSLPSSSMAWLVSLFTSCFLILADSGWRQLKTNYQQIKAL